MIKVSKSFVRTSQKTHCFFITKLKKSKLYRSQSVYSENQTICGQNSVCKGEGDSVHILRLMCFTLFNVLLSVVLADPFGCDHHRAPAYFAESITSNKGFWGWYCPSFTRFLLGLCPPRYPAVIMGDKVPSE